MVNGLVRRSGSPLPLPPPYRQSRGLVCGGGPASLPFSNGGLARLSLALVPSDTPRSSSPPGASSSATSPAAVPARPSPRSRPPLRLRAPRPVRGGRPRSSVLRRPRLSRRILRRLPCGRGVRGDGPRASPPRGLAMPTAFRVGMSTEATSSAAAAWPLSSATTCLRSSGRCVGRPPPPLRRHRGRHSPDP